MRVERGRLRFTVDGSGAFLREIIVAGEEAFRGLGFVVRDANWGTPQLEASPMIVERAGALRIESGGTLRCASGDLHWTVVWTIDDNSIAARAEWSSVTGFATNRTGFVALHSVASAKGRDVLVTHSDGRKDRAVFPILISPHQPIFDIANLAYETTGGVAVAIAFGGETFESEDQRNWSDASYKTYSRPLRLPYPYRIEPGQTVAQTLRVDFAAPSITGARLESEEPVMGPEVPLALIGSSLRPGPLHPRTRDAIGALALNFTAIELDLAAPRPLADLKEKLACAGPRIRVDIRPAARDSILDAAQDLASALATSSLLGVTLWGADDSLIEQARSMISAPIGAAPQPFSRSSTAPTRCPHAPTIWLSPRTRPFTTSPTTPSARRPRSRRTCSPRFCGGRRVRSFMSGC